jgi:hypothetical protein
MRSNGVAGEGDDGSWIVTAPWREVTIHDKENR